MLKNIRTHTNNKNNVKIIETMENIKYTQKTLKQTGKDIEHTKKMKQ